MKSIFQSYHSVDDHILEGYLSHWKEFSAPKKSIITYADQTERYLYLVREGIQKSYYIKDGKEHVMFFAYAPSFSGIVESFLTQTPSNYFLESITDSAFLRIPYQKHIELIRAERELETVFRKITEGFLLGIIQRHHELLSYSAEERFKSFVARSPHLLNMVPQKDISSYLRIDATNFSKMINSIVI